MRYIRMLLSFFLSAFLLLALPLTAYAGTASSSDASRSDALRPPVAFGSNALRPPMDDFVGSDAFDDLTVPYDGQRPIVVADVYQINSSAHNYKYNVVGTVEEYDDLYYKVTFPEPMQDDYYYRNVYYRLDKSKLPKPGDYGISFSFMHYNKHVENIIPYASGASFTSKVTNVNDESNCVDQNQGWVNDILYAEYNVSIGYNTNNLNLIMFIEPYTSGFSVLVPRYKPWSFTFSKYDTAKPVVPPDVENGSGSSDNVIADNTTQQVEQGDTIIELIKNTIQTISSQLTAFWNQLAGEFTNLYNKMNAHHSEDLAKVDEQISADRQNTDDLISNQDKNTDTMVNGYDNSGMNSDNDRLNSSLTEYGQAEDNLMGDVNKHIGSIDFDYSFDSIVNVVGSVSDFFQGIYERSGQFQIVINVCLILSLASCAVGIYRLKGGG